MLKYDREDSVREWERVELSNAFISSPEIIECRPGAAFSGDLLFAFAFFEILGVVGAGC